MGVRTRNDDSFRRFFSDIIEHGVVVIRPELLVAHASFGSLQEFSDVDLALIDLEPGNAVDENLVQLAVPPFLRLVVCEVDVDAVALPPVMRLAVVHAEIARHSLVVGTALLLLGVLAFLVDVAGQPEDDANALLLEPGDHRGRIGVAVGIPGEIIIAEAPRAVDDDAADWNLMFQIKARQLFRRLRRVFLVFPDDVPECPCGRDRGILRKDRGGAKADETEGE